MSESSESESRFGKSVSTDPGSRSLEDESRALAPRRRRRQTRHARERSYTYGTEVYTLDDDDEEW